MSIDDSAIRAQVEKILSSRHFLGLPRLGAFLRFIVEETIAGRQAAIKEYVVGVEVYRREATFDPKLDSTVRVEASKLRARLREHRSPTSGSAKGDSLSLATGWSTRFAKLRRISGPSAHRNGSAPKTGSGYAQSRGRSAGRRISR
jgi:hypothetical protein